MKKGEIDQEFWSGKKVLVTGHTGFKGSWLSLWLHSLGAQVFGLSLPPEEESFYRAVDLSSHVKDYFFDIGDESKVREVLEEVKPDLILHLAAQALVIDSYQDPIGTYRTNVMGTLHLLQAAQEVGTAKAFLNITTDKCYENQSWTWGYREIDPLGGHDPYSSSKACSEILTSSFRRSFLDSAEGKMNLASVRAGNVFGGGDWSKNRLIPDAAKAFSQDKKVVLRNPETTRPWQFVLEPLRAYLMLCEALYQEPGKCNEAWNVGPEDCDVVSVEKVIHLFSHYWGRQASYEVVLQEGAVHEQSRLKLDSSKIKEKLSWSQNVSLEKGLEACSIWYKSYYDPRISAKDLFKLSLKQITAAQGRSFYPESFQSEELHKYH